MINFKRVVPGVARSNNCRGLLIVPGEARTDALWLCRFLVPERKSGFFGKVKEGENFNRRNTRRILRIKI
ncbi:MAG: hypothetical protein R6T92_06755 [Desulfosalsimonadaceae bacterium]